VGLTPAQITEQAGALWGAQGSRTAIDPPTAWYPELTAQEAYAVARMNIDRQLAAGASIAGRKIGLTSRAMQQQLGVESPDYGVLLDGMLQAGGSAIRRDDLLQPRAEAEIAVRLTADLAGPEVTAADVSRAIAEVVPAIEVIDSRIRDWKISLADTIADNASSGLAVVGPGLAWDPDRDLRDLEVELAVDGVVTQRGSGADIITGPLEVIAWLARAIAPFGEGLRGGDLILAGAVHAAIPLAAGHEYTARYSWGMDVTMAVV
jgi:2-keto-4-pentenoate hydratase